MDGAPKSKRLFPSYTLAELYEAVKSPFISESQRDKLNIAISQRDLGSSDYVPILKIPQL